MLKDPECAARYEESVAATEAPAYEVTLEYSWRSPEPLAPTALLPEPSREAIVQFQEHLAQFPQLDLPPQHYFAPGMYGRNLPIPAESFVVGKIHKHQHITILLTGKATINTDKGMETITGPHIWISQTDAKRALYTHTDCQFFTCHLNPNDETDLEVLESQIIEPELLALNTQGVLA